METWLDIQGCAFWSHKDSEGAVILLIQMSLFEWQYGLTAIRQYGLNGNMVVEGQTILPFTQL